MTPTTIYKSPFLRTSRNFPLDAQPLSVETNKSYVDIANAVNARTIGIYSTAGSFVTGNMWTLDSSQRQQSLRQVYLFTSTTAIPHGLMSFSSISPITYGSFTDGTNWYGLPYSSNVAIAGQISFYITPTDIVFLTGAGAPTLTSGMIVLEWIAQG